MSLSSPRPRRYTQKNYPTPEKNATRLIYFLYQVLQLALTPAVALYLLYRGIRDRRYFAGLAERLGFLPGHHSDDGQRRHLVSRRIGGRGAFRGRTDPRDLRCPSRTAPCSSRPPRSPDAKRRMQKLEGLADGVFFAPLDYRSVVRRVLRRLRPAAVVVLETEIWPNLYRESKRAGASLMVVNGRISDRALPRYRRWQWFFRHVLRWPTRFSRRPTRTGGVSSPPGAAGTGAGRRKSEVRFHAARRPALRRALRGFLDRIEAAKRCGSRPAPCLPRTRAMWMRTTR